MASKFSLFFGLIAVVVLISSEVAANELTKTSSTTSDQINDTKAGAKLDDSKTLGKLGGGYPGGYNGGGYYGGNYPDGGYHGGGYSGGNYPGGGYSSGGCYNGCCLSMPFGWCIKCCNYATNKASEKQVEINGHN